MSSKKVRRTLSALLLLTAIAVTQIPVSDVMAQAVASDFQIDGKNLIKYAGTTEQVVSIPSGVKSIAEASFAGHNELVKVTTGEDVEKIGNAAFTDCKSLRTIIIGDSVKEIESGAFSKCPNLESVTLGAGVKALGSGVFAGCSKLKNITIDKSNIHLTYNKGIIYGDKGTTICQMLPGYEEEFYEVPNTVSQIQGYAFWGNPYLKDVTLGSKLSEIPAYAFSNCVNLQQVSIPYFVRSIGAKAFEDCVNLKKINIPESVTYIHETAFDGCPRVEFTTVEGSYGARYVAGRDVSQVALTEQTEVEEATIIHPEEVTEEEPGDEQPEPTPEAVTGMVAAENLMGKSTIVSGRAMVFIDNKETKVYSGNESAAQRLGDAPESDGTGTVLENLLHGSDEKGSGFPKYTIVDDKVIADQAYYQETELTSYEIPQSITEIGDFAFARTGLKEINIPEGVQHIGYGAFYHCDNLQNVTIPETVTEIEPSAFDNTGWIKNWKNNVGQDYLIVGDGILIAYAGKESVVNIPNEVKSIAAGVFKDHTGITAVNIPANLQIIGEEAFAGCRNLKTVNGMDGVTEIKDRAFWNCPLSKAYIPESVKKIGMRAFDLSEGGTGSVTFGGNELPELSAEKTAMRLTNEEYRGLAFGKMDKAFINNVDVALANSILDETLLGFRGAICLPDGTVVTENSRAVNTQDAGVAVRINSDSLNDDGNIASATIPGGNGSYVLKITDSDSAAEQIKKAYGSIYGNREPSGLHAYDISLYEQQGNSRITKLGKQYMTVLLPKPAGMGSENIHVVCVDANGQLEEVPHQMVQTEEHECIQFTASHFSAYGIYQYSDGFGATAVVNNGKAVFSSLSGTKDASPDTGDLIHPKWFFAMGLLCAAIALFFYKGKERKGL